MRRERVPISRRAGSHFVRQRGVRLKCWGGGWLDDVAAW